MKIFSITNYKLPGGFKQLHKKIDYLNSKAEKLMESKTTVTGLLPNSMRKCSGTKLTVSQMIELVLKNV